MKIIVNGDPRQCAAATLADLLHELDQGDARVATAVNESFVPATARAGCRLNDGDRVEILSPRQGG